MNLEKLKKQADVEYDKKKKVIELKNTIRELSNDFENELNDYKSRVKDKMNILKENIKQDFIRYFQKEGFTIKQNNHIEYSNTYAEYKGLKIELEINEESFQINCKEEEIYDCYELEQIEDQLDGKKLESWGLYQKYKESPKDIYSIEKLEELVKFLKYENRSYQYMKGNVDEIKFRYKYHNENKYANSMHEILESTFNNDK
ncbi:hypothetical protein [Clostridium ljungdahlii]|uniref:Uncharacterized protein n=1 Tax=Clostridium ljungdahlii (strain ATCC 55383 / DSM 13528 / PETC) TaxID=748727 RepID=D8GU87_CLOLD|nr:hypothetical protein [Clostridium ljungdahlii]ADK14750.1 hypothetical protein CLJU_c16860 [Clostridium ljungdahlii DSM 13528]OAA84107.1 hypothetical protein WX45_01951 [Clostridium ljungdahlii DSM 13528]